MTPNSGERMTRAISRARGGWPKNAEKIRGFFLSAFSGFAWLMRAAGQSNAPINDLRAAIRIGELSRELEKAQGFASIRPNDRTNTKTEVLANAGIPRQTANDYEQLTGGREEQAMAVAKGNPLGIANSRAGLVNQL
jgi:hypothetical protein